MELREGTYGDIKVGSRWRYQRFHNFRTQDCTEAVILVLYGEYAYCERGCDCSISCRGFTISPRALLRDYLFIEEDQAEEPQESPTQDVLPESPTQEEWAAAKEEMRQAYLAKYGGFKADSGKAPMHLVPWDAIWALCSVLAVGATKYTPRNWERGMSWSRPWSACMRHLTAWWNGEDKDPETGMSHLWHALCCIVFLVAYERRGMTSFDDRPTTTNREQHDEEEV